MREIEIENGEDGSLGVCKTRSWPPPFIPDRRLVALPQLMPSALPVVAILLPFLPLPRLIALPAVEEARAREGDEQFGDSEVSGGREMVNG